MPDSRDEQTETAARLPWESIGDDVVPSAAAPEADLNALAAAVAARTGDVGETGAVELLDYADERDADAESAAEPGAVDYEHPIPAEPVEDDLGPAPKGGGWTVAALSAGICIIACCVIIPQADANRRLAYERERLKVDLDSLRKQVSTNDEFLRRVADDPNLAERLAQRQMKIIREGTRVLELKKPANAPAGGAGPAQTPQDISPFHLVAVAPPPPMPPYQPNGGRLAGLCYDSRKRLYLMGVGLFLMAAGLVCGFAPKQ